MFDMRRNSRMKIVISKRCRWIYVSFLTSVPCWIETITFNDENSIEIVYKCYIEQKKSKKKKNVDDESF